MELPFIQWRRPPLPRLQCIPKMAITFEIEKRKMQEKRVGNSFCGFFTIDFRIVLFLCAPYFCSIEFYFGCLCLVTEPSTENNWIYMYLFDWFRLEWRKELRECWFCSIFFSRFILFLFLHSIERTKTKTISISICVCVCVRFQQINNVQWNIQSEWPSMPRGKAKENETKCFYLIKKKKRRMEKMKSIGITHNHLN